MKKKKFFNVMLAGLMIVPCAFAFSACGKKPAASQTGAKFTAAENVSASTDAIVKSLTDNVYNASALGSSTKYTVSEMKEKINDFKYYVEIGSVEGIDDVDSLTIGNSTFDDDDTFDLSVGKSNYISDKCFYEEDNKIFVAAPIVAFESVNNKKIKVNESEFDFDLEKTAQNKSFTDAKFSTGSTNAIEKKQDGVYDVEFKDAKTFLKLYFDGAKQEDVVLTKKVVSGSGNADLNGKVSYGLTLVENEANYPLGFYPIGYSNDALTEAFVTWYDGATMNYQAYVIDGGVYSATLNFDIILQAASE